MKQLTAKNIRKGLEINVSIEDIFKIDPSAQGDILAMKLHLEKWNNIKELNGKKFKDIFPTPDAMLMYNTKAIEHQITDTLKAYTSTCYMASYDYEDDESDIKKLLTSEFEEVQFICTKRLSYIDFLINFMEAQAFSGSYKTDFKHSFIGVGDFELEEYLDNHDLASCANMHLLDFYIFKFNILSSIGDFIMANYIKDLKQQKEYVNPNDYNEILKAANKHKRSLNRVTRDFIQGFQQED